MKTTILLVNGFRFQGELLEETDTSITIQEVKLGKTTFYKTGIAARSDEE